MPRLRRFTACAMVALLPVALGAQDAGVAAAPRSPLDDLILKVEADVNDLRYADAIRRGNEIIGFTDARSPAQEVRLRSALAAAYYPEEPEFQRPDSAVAQLVAMLRAAPDGAIPIELRWRGLDSLFEVASSLTHAVRIEPAAPQVLVGEAGRGTVSVLASRPSHFRLRLTPAAGGVGVVHDSTSVASRSATLTYRALQGRHVLLTPGAYEIAVIAIDPATGDSVVVRRAARVEGAALILLPTPVFDESRLRPERKRASWLKTGVVSIAVAGLTIVGGAVFLAASGEEGDEDLGAAVGAVGLAVGGLTAFTIHRPKDDPAAAAANAELRAAHRRAVDAADAENQRRLAAYQVTVRH
jgi:hypothetical protein